MSIPLSIPIRQTITLPDDWQQCRTPQELSYWLIARYDALVAQFETLQSQILPIPGQITDMSAAISGLRESISQIGEQITTINGAINTMSGTLGQHSFRLATIETTVSIHSSDISEIGGEVSTISSQLAEMQDDVNGLNTMVNDHTININQMNNDIFDIRGLITTIENTVNVHSNDISQMTEDINQHSTAINNLSTGLSTAENQIAQNTQSISALEAILNSIEPNPDTTGQTLIPLTALKIGNAYFSITSGAGNQPQLFVPDAEISGTTLYIDDNPDNGAFTNGYKILVDGVETFETSNYVYDLASITNNTAQITVKAYGNNFRDSATSMPVTYYRHFDIGLYDSTTLLYTESVAYGSMPSYRPTKSGFRFLYWTDSNGNRVTQITEATSLYAYFVADDIIFAGTYINRSTSSATDFVRRTSHTFNAAYTVTYGDSTQLTFSTMSLGVSGGTRTFFGDVPNVGGRSILTGSASSGVITWGGPITIVIPADITVNTTAQSSGADIVTAFLSVFEPQP